MPPSDMSPKDPASASEQSFEKYYTIEEAVRALPEVTDLLGKAHQELFAIRDQIILYKRMQITRLNDDTFERDDEDEDDEPPESAILQDKWAAYERAFNRWLQQFEDRGILLKDLDRGLVDFPYRSKKGEELFLCWQLGEEGLFYFHDIREGFSGRKPISLLPE